MFNNQINIQRLSINRSPRCTSDGIRHQENGESNRVLFCKTCRRQTDAAVIKFDLRRRPHV